ncbi:MAG: hypothetical protein SAK29_41620, partial [Scytonema sp. PMC 1069.18]|nr:hypothetical protein [Scytonema sp. PMC 1069.18]
FQIKKYPKISCGTGVPPVSEQVKARTPRKMDNLFLGSSFVSGEKPGISKIPGFWGLAFCSMLSNTFDKS